MHTRMYVGLHETRIPGAEYSSTCSHVHVYWHPFIIACVSATYRHMIHIQINIHMSKILTCILTDTSLMQLVCAYIQSQASTHTHMYTCIYAYIHTSHTHAGCVLGFAQEPHPNGCLKLENVPFIVCHSKLGKNGRNQLINALCSIGIHTCVFMYIGEH